MLDFLLLPTIRTYWHDHVQASNPQTISFLDSPQDTSTPAYVSLSFNGSNWIDHQGVDNISSLRKALHRSYKRFTQTTIWATLERFWVQNPKYKGGTRGTLISLSLPSQKCDLGFPLYSGRSRSETLILNGLKLLFGPT